jgi:hypothetical protein
VGAVKLGIEERVVRRFKPPVPVYHGAIVVGDKGAPAAAAHAYVRAIGNDGQPVFARLQTAILEIVYLDIKALKTETLACPRRGYSGMFPPMAD